MQLIRIDWADPGDRVEVDEPIAQIETDKVLFFESNCISLFGNIFWLMRK